MLLLHCLSLQTCVLAIGPSHLEDGVSNSRVKATKKPKLALLDRLLVAFIVFVFTHESQRVG